MIRIAIALAIAMAMARPVHAKGCHEVSAVVGRQRCSYFGTWSRDASAPPLWGELVVQRNNFVAAPFTLDKTPLVATGQENLAAQATAISLRILMGSLVFGGIELHGGALTRIPQASGATPAVTGGYLAGALVVGVHAALWRFGFGAELAGGGRAVDLESCDTKNCVGPNSWQTRRQLEARVRLDVFTAPRFSIGVVVGHGLVAGQGSTFMVDFAGHVRAMDGM